MRQLTKFLLLMLSLLTSAIGYAEPVNWRLQLGGMRNILRSPRKAHDAWAHYSLMIGVEIQVPLVNRWYIESGANLRLGPVTYTEDGWGSAENIPLKYFDKSGDYIGPLKTGERKPEIANQYSGFVDIPLRAGWKLPFNDENEFQFSVGPYVSLDFVGNFAPEYGRNCCSVGLSPSVVYKHRGLTLGLFYSNPFIYNGQKNRETNNLMFTIGINFNGRTPNWDNLTRVLEVTGAVLDATSNTLTSYYQAATSNIGTSYQNEESSTTNTTSENSASKKTSDHWLSDKTNRDADKVTYFKEADLVRKIISGDDTVNKKQDVQNRMKKIRKKWVKRNMGWDAVPEETM